MVGARSFAEASATGLPARAALRPSPADGLLASASMISVMLAPGRASARRGERVAQRIDGIAVDQSRIAGVESTDFHG